mgnify:CR=1 FL=1
MVANGRGPGGQQSLDDSNIIISKAFFFAVAAIVFCFLLADGRPEEDELSSCKAIRRRQKGTQSQAGQRTEADVVVRRKKMQAMARRQGFPPHC